mmetsp:Transcript_20189/g.43724  ORF Transcript_20189/g.43724 Transcript_20189/m.43724 type:complete len:94 (-) Transcript_20189:3-284(-)
MISLQFGTTQRGQCLALIALCLPRHANDTHGVAHLYRLHNPLQRAIEIGVVLCDVDGDVMLFASGWSNPAHATPSGISCNVGHLMQRRSSHAT